METNILNLLVKKLFSICSFSSISTFPCSKHTCSGNNFSRNPLVFDLEKSKKLLKESYDLAKGVKGAISNNSLYYYKTFEAEPANILYRQALVNLYLTEPGNVGLLPKYDLFLDKLDPKEGLKILHYLADQNHTVALHELGKIYLEGIYVKKNFG